MKTYTTHVAVCVTLCLTSPYRAPFLPSIILSFDVPHMPEGCGTWPAAWETDGNDWPNGGEVDIVGPAYF